MQIVSNPIPCFTGLDGSPLEGGKLYFGTVNQNPETNPTTVYWDSALTQPAAQPIRTIGGMPARNGTPTNLYTSGAYSLTVRSKTDTLLYSFMDSTLTAMASALAIALADPNGSSLIGFDVSSTFASGALGGAVKNRGISAKDFPYLAYGDGIHDDTAAIQAAVNSLNGKGGVVYLPATGAAYKTTDTISLPNGVVLMGSLAKNFAGSTATNDQWTAAGSWLNPTHASNPAVRLQGHGSGISGIGFIHVQPIPSGGSWTPNVYGYCIEQIASHTAIEDILIVNASHGIYLKYTTGSGGGTQVRWRDVVISAYQVRMRTTCVNDTAYLSNIHMRNLWYSSDSRVVDYIRANTKGWYCGYTDNIMVDGLEFFEDYRAMYFEDETCLGNTHSLYNATLHNVQFNLPQVCMAVATNTTTVHATFGNVVSQTGNAFGRTWGDTAFQLASSNVKMKFNGLTVNDAGGQLFDFGGASGGLLVIDNLDVEQYSSVSAGQVGFGIAAGANVRLANYRIKKIAGAGLRFAGAGLENLSTDAYGQVSQFGRFGEQSLAGSGAFQDFSTDSYLRFGQMRVHQARLLGQLNITAAVASTTAEIKLAGGITELSLVGITTAATGYQSFDSGWVDITEANLVSLAILGRLQVKAAAGVNFNNGSINILYR